jgi:hypothetical protein
MRAQPFIQKSCLPVNILVIFALNKRYMKKLLLPLFLLFTICAYAQDMRRTVRFFAIDRDNQRVLLKNWDSIPRDITNYRFGAKGDSSAGIGSISIVLFGSIVIPKNSVVGLQLTSSFLLDDTSDLSLHYPDTSGAMGDTATLIDFVQWQDSSQGGFEDQAIMKGYWTKGDFISVAPPYVYNGNHYQRGISFWQSFTIPEINIRLCYVKPGSDIFAVKNFGPSNYDISTLKISSSLLVDTLNTPPIQLIKG